MDVRTDLSFYLSLTVSVSLNRFRMICFLALPLAAAVLAPAQQSTVAFSELPEAPSVIQVGVQASQPQMGSLSGIVKDVTGGLVPGATISATSLGSPGEFTATSDSGGNFSLVSLPAGRYKLTVQAEGLATLVMPEVNIAASQQLVLPEFALAAAATTSEVSVVATQDQIATEQVRAQEKQRAIGFVPNFYTSYIWKAAPMPTRQKFGLASHSAFDPVALIAITGVAGIEQWRNIYAGYGDDAGAFGKRYAAAFGDEAIGRFLGSAIYPTIFHQDPRYFYKGSGSTRSRALYAMSRSVITRGDNGRQQPNYSRILGRFTAGAIANSYHPHADRGVGLTLANASINLGVNALDNLFREFVLRKITPNVPAYANGDNSPTP